MSALSNYLEDRILNHILGNTTYTPPTDLYVALFTTDPTDADAGTEVSGNGYARQTVTFDLATGGVGISNSEVLFPLATGSWGAVSHAGVYDAATGGNLLWHGALENTKTIEVDDQFRIPSGNFSISID